ncbi:MAG: hypothetical protein K6C05_09490 [Anaerovibrio sp.]|uniref:hypothetical protein n=1 Tax=Anaerovibrio sp. TaxID=1872532 RepID=UPI0025E19A0C|nr:hypothetical protein [Anaerovibrio sp.]MCR5177065.1 hypothetical protein [Anaerovibrio sp.]
MRKITRIMVGVIAAITMIISLISIPPTKIDANAEGEVIEWTLGYEFTVGQEIRKGTVIKNRWEYHHKPAGYAYWCTYFNCLSVGIAGLDHRDELFGDVNREMERTGYTYDDAGDKNGEIWEQISETTYVVPFDCVVAEYEEPTWVSGEAGNSGVTAAGLTLIPKCELSIYAYYLEHNLDINGYAGVKVDSGCIEQLTVDNMNQLSGKEYDYYNIDIIYVSSDGRDKAIEWKKNGKVYDNGNGLPDSENVDFVRENISFTGDISNHFLEFPYEPNNGMGTKINYTTKWEVLGFNFDETNSVNNCGICTLYVVSVDGAPHKHTLSDWQCADSYHYKYCTECHTYGLERANHTNEFTIIKVPTPEELGEYGFRCTVCGYMDRVYSISYDNYNYMFPPEDHVHEFENYFYNTSEHWSYCNSCADGTIREAHNLVWKAVSPETADGADDAKICYGCDKCAYIKEEKTVTQDEYEEIANNQGGGQQDENQQGGEGQNDDQQGDNKQNNQQNINNKTDNSQKNNQASNQGNTNKSGNSKKETSYSNEWVDGKWYDKNGNQTYKGKLSWKKNASGWWIEDSSGWYPKSQWQKIDGKYYYFDESGYMAADEWRDGCWLGSDGAWDDTYKMTWKSDSKGWWIEDKTGWYPQNQWQKIDGNWYYFKGDGYMATSQYINGWWVDSNGVCQ